MNKMNRSSSSRRNKTLLNDDSGSWIGHPLPPKQTNLSNSYLDSNKQNNSLFQSISERNFPVQPKERLNSEYESNDINMQFYEKCKKLQKELKSKNMLVDELQQKMADSGVKAYNYPEQYYEEEIKYLKELLDKKDCSVLKQDYETRPEDMESISSEVNTRIEREQRDQKDKNLYIKELSKKNIENTHLQERIKYHKAEIETLRLCLQEKEKTIQEYSDKIGHVDMKKRKMEHYEIQIKEREEMLKELEMQTQRLKEETQNKDMLIYEQSNKVGELEQTIGSYDDKLKSIEMALIRIKEEKKSMMEKNEEVNRQCQEWKQNYEYLLSKSDQYQEFEFKLKTSQSLIEDLNKKTHELTKENQRMKINSASTQKSLVKYQEIQKDMINLKKELKEKEERIYEFQSRQKSLKNMQQYNTKLRKEKDEYFTRFQQKLKETKNLHLQNQELKQKINNLQQELLEQQQSNERDKKRCDKLDILIHQNTKLNNNLQEKINEIQKLQIKLSNMESKINDKNNEIMRSKGEIQEKQQEINEINIAIKDIHERYEVETNNRIMEEDKVLKCNQENYSLKCAIGKLEDEKEGLEESIQEMEGLHQKEKEALNDALGEMHRVKDQTERVLKDYKESVETLRGEVEDNRQEIEEWSQKQGDHRFNLTQLEALIVELRGENSDLRTKQGTMLNNFSQMRKMCDSMMTPDQK